MTRMILAVLAGLVAAVLAIMTLQALGHLIYPPPLGLDPRDSEAMREIIAQLPLGALLMVMLAYAIGSIVGGGVASLMARSKRPRAALIVGGLLFLGGVVNFIMLPHPLWFAAVSLALFFPCAYLGHKLAQSRSPDL